MKPRKRQPRRRALGVLSLPLMIGEIFAASAETIARRTGLIAQGRCSAAEYRRMVAEKTEAAQRSIAALAGAPGKDTMRAVLAPWHSRVTANAKRLRKR